MAEKSPSVIHVRLSVSVIIASDNVPHAPQMGDKRSEMNGFCDPYASGTRMKISLISIFVALCCICAIMRVEEHSWTQNSLS